MGSEAGAGEEGTVGGGVMIVWSSSSVKEKSASLSSSRVSKKVVGE